MLMMCISNGRKKIGLVIKNKNFQWVGRKKQGGSMKVIEYNWSYSKEKNWLNDNWVKEVK